MSNDNLLGLDGFTTKFNKFFWTDIKHIVFESFKYSLQHDEASETQREGVLSLIPKKMEGIICI